MIEELKNRQIIGRDSRATKICDQHYTVNQLKTTVNGRKRLSNAHVIPTENLLTLNNEENVIKVCPVSTANGFFGSSFEVVLLILLHLIINWPFKSLVKSSPPTVVLTVLLTIIWVCVSLYKN